MTRDSHDHTPKEHARAGHGHVDRDGRFAVRKARSQGIVRDERGQEQPADKERAQRVSKSK